MPFGIPKKFEGNDEEIEERRRLKIDKMA